MAGYAALLKSRLQAVQGCFILGISVSSDMHDHHQLPAIYLSFCKHLVKCSLTWSLLADSYCNTCAVKL